MDELSKYLADQIAFLDEELTAEQLAEYAAEREQLLTSVEGFYRGAGTIFVIYGNLKKASKKLSPVLEETAAWSLDDCLARFMVSEIPQMVSRAMQLEPLLIDQGARVDENPYLREATRCYMFGLFNASIALSRSALEFALSKRIPALLLGNSREEKLYTLIRTARSSVLKKSPEICDLADATRRKANAAIHQKISREAEALSVLVDTRKVLGFLYADSR